MKKIIAICLLITITACTSKKEGNMIVQGQIKGLKKGTLYLQKMQDTLLVSVDSIALLGKDTFLLTDDVEAPVMYYLTFDGNTTDKRILFFADKGINTFNDDITKFGYNPKISGSKNQEILEKYYQMTDKFRGKNLDLIKEQFEARRDGNDEESAKILKKSENLLKRRYLYTTNFVLNNGDYEAAPYIALTELVDANVKLLDTINSRLSDKVKNSPYGKRFDDFLMKIKNTEK